MAIMTCMSVCEKWLIKNYQFLEEMSFIFFQSILIEYHQNPVPFPFAEKCQFTTIDHCCR